MHVGLRIFCTTLAALVTTATSGAFQAGPVQESGVSHQGQAEAQRTVVVPQWPYPLDLPKGSPLLVPDDGEPRHLPGSSRAYRMKDINGSSAVDWFPDAHPEPPVAVRDGRPGAYRACGSCHLINGYGKPDEQSLNGLPIAYMRQQLADMKDDLRHSSRVQGGQLAMVAVAKALSDDDANEALKYFHSIGPAKWIRVVETDTVPKTTLGRHGLWIPDAGGAKEPIGNRILELAESYDRTLLRDPTSGYVAYVPLGSLAKGETLARTGAKGRTTACATCHGPDLRGNSVVPPIAGRSPTIIARQLYDFKTGARHGKASGLMKLPVEPLTDEDIVDISSYAASLPQ